MCGRLFGVGIALAVVILVGSAVLADFYTFEGPAGVPGYGLSVVDGKVRLVKTTRGLADWRVESAEKGRTIRLGAGYGKFTGQYLSYDVTGKDKKVFLSEKPGPGSYWELYPRQNRTTIQATAGKAKGWFLNVGGAAEILKDSEQNEFTAKTVILTETAKPIPLYHSEVQAP
jgi:hypothetical protein